MGGVEGEELIVAISPVLPAAHSTQVPAGAEAKILQSRGKTLCNRGRGQTPTEAVPGSAGIWSLLHLGPGQCKRPAALDSRALPGLPLQLSPPSTGLLEWTPAPAASDVHACMLN